MGLHDEVAMSGKEGTTRKTLSVLDLGRGDPLRQIASPFTSFGFHMTKGTKSKQEGSTPNSHGDRRDANRIMPPSTLTREHFITPQISVPINSYGCIISSYETLAKQLNSLSHFQWLLWTCGVWSVEKGVCVGGGMWLGDIDMIKGVSPFGKL